MAFRLPGIDVTIVNDTGRVAPPIYERYPVIIGEGDPYRVVSDQKIVRSLGTVDSIPALTTVDEISSVGDYPGISKYVKDVDYTLGGTNIISWIGTSKPTLGNSYYITYTETRAASAYVPRLYFNENNVFTGHGWKDRSNGAINDISVGASLAFMNSSQGVVVAQLDLSTATDPDLPTNLELENAFLDMVAELKKIVGYKLYLVPMSSGVLSTSTASQIMFNHAILSSEPGRRQERTVVGVMPKSTTYQQYAAQAAAYFHHRMILPASPADIQVVGQTGAYDTRFHAAALAGKICSTPIGVNISDEILAGITISDTWDPDVLEYLVKRGVSPINSKGGIVRNVMCITTETTSALTEDVGVQEVKDYVRKYWRERLWELYKNAPITDALTGQVENTSKNIMNYLIDKNIITDYGNITAEQDETEPRKINLSGRVMPAYGMQWMDVVFTFVLSMSSS